MGQQRTNFPRGSEAGATKGSKIVASASQPWKTELAAGRAHRRLSAAPLTQAAAELRNNDAEAQAGGEASAPEGLQEVACFTTCSFPARTKQSLPNLPLVSMSATHQ
jgi:hypothetical protein